MTDDQTPPSAPRTGPAWSAPSGPPAGTPLGPQIGPGPQGWYAHAPAVPKKRHAVLTHTAVALVAVFIGVGIGQSGGPSSGGKEAAAAATAGPATTTPATTGPSQTATADPMPETTKATKATTTKPAPAEPKPTKKPGPPTSFDGDGEYLVGEDIAPGTYRTAGPADFGCYWERDRDSSGEFKSIITNDNLSGSGRVTVRKGEIFKTQGCQTWKKVS